MTPKLEVIKKHTSKFHESIKFQLDKYMGADNHYILVKLSNILKDEAYVYLTEIDTAISINKSSLSSIDMSEFLEEYNDKKIVYWTYRGDDSKPLFEGHDNVVFKNVLDYSYLELDEDENSINVQQFFAKNFSFIEHLSTNKKWTRDFLNHTMRFPTEIKSVHDIRTNDGSPDFVYKDVSVDSGKGIYLFDKEDYDKELFDGLYCEEYIPSDYHFNTFHLCGKNKSFDITNYDDFQYLENQLYKVHDKKINISAKSKKNSHSPEHKKKFTSYYESLHVSSSEY